MNCGPLTLESTALSTEPQPLSKTIIKQFLVFPTALLFEQKHIFCHCESNRDCLECSANLRSTLKTLNWQNLKVRNVQHTHFQNNKITTFEILTFQHIRNNNGAIRYYPIILYLVCNTWMIHPLLSPLVTLYNDGCNHVSRTLPICGADFCAI